ncbi:MAG TPA: hypothetical protein VIV64_04410 [Gammaproteobacteria bacterium]
MNARSPLAARDLVLGIGLAGCLATAAEAQIGDSIRGAPGEANHFIETPAGWEHPLTSWGEPDIGAMLDMMQASRLPLERCGDQYPSRLLPTFLFGERSAPDWRTECDPDKTWLTEAEYDAEIAAWLERTDVSVAALAEGNLGLSLSSGATDPNVPQRQTNLLVDPPNGLLPELTAEGKRRALSMRSSWALPGENHTYDGPADFDSWDRCLTRGMPSSMMPYRYNGGFRIVQAPGYVVFQLEMIHEARVIPTDGRAALAPAIGQYLGESRGRWEGTTLVVETTNYREGPPLINLGVLGSPPGNRFPHSDRMKTTERIVRLNDDWWLYEVTTEDPVVLTRPFTVRYPMRHDPGYFMPEYACHESNTIVPNYVETNRAERADLSPQAAAGIELPAEVAGTLIGRWVGRPRIVTIDLDIALEFVRDANGAVAGRLIGTTLGEIGQPLRSLAYSAGVLRFELPNWQPWGFAGELAADGTLSGALISSQGGVPVTFRRSEAPANAGR